MTHYVLGFLFDFERDRVVLIRKNRPDWQKGRLNGIGGKIEGCETPRQAMIREFKEETGAEFNSWDNFAILQGTDFIVHVFSGFNSRVVDEVRSNTDEPVEIHCIDTVDFRNTEVISNLPWLLPLALNPSDIILPVEVNYKK